MRNLPHLNHQAVELVGIQRLVAITEGAVWVAVYLDDEAVGSHRHRRPRQRGNLVALAGSVARIHDDGQMAEPLHRGNYAEIQRVAGVIRKRPHATFTQNDVVVTFAHDVLGRHQELFQRGRHPAFEQHRLARLASAFQQREVLHVAGANLDDVGVLVHQRQGFVVHGFRYDEQAEVLTDFGENLQPKLTQSLEGIRRGTWFERSASKEPRTRFGNSLGRGERLLARFHTARPRYHRDFLAADGSVGVGKANHRILFLQFSTD